MIKTENIIHLSAPSFKKAIGKGIVLVDFWAQWCAPCRMQNPILEELVSEIDNRALISKLNVDDNREIASEYGIRSIPTIIIFKDGVVARQFVGVQQKQTLIKALNSLV